jgi:hypothetical protein
MKEPRRATEDEVRAKEASEALARVSRDSETIGGSAVKRAVRHFAGDDAPKGAEGRRDSIEIWGRRIGRAIGLLIVVYLALSLISQYGR